MRKYANGEAVVLMFVSCGVPAFRPLFKPLIPGPCNQLTRRSVGHLACEAAGRWPQSLHRRHRTRKLYHCTAGQSMKHTMQGAPVNGAVSDGDPFAGAMPKEEIGALRFLKV